MEIEISWRRSAVAGVAVVAAVASVVAAAGVRADPPSTAIATSATAFYERDTITLPDRSRAFVPVDETVSCGTPGPARIEVDGKGDDWRGEPTWIAGTGRIDRGEAIWTDYPYDDDGTGTLTYPGEGQPLEDRDGAVGRATALNQRYGANAADVVELRATADPHFLYLLARFNFLNAVGSTVLGLAFDTARDSELAGGEWPHGARVRTAGADTFVTVHAPCPRVTTVDGDVLLTDLGGGFALSTAGNAMELALPRSLFGADILSVAAGTGVWDPAAGTWMEPQLIPRTNRNNQASVVGAQGPDDPALFNLLFRSDEPLAVGGTQRTFQTEKQQQALRSGTTGDYRMELDLAQLRGSAPGPVVVRRGHETDFVRVYRSRLDAEGVIQTSGSTALFLGRYQPYGAVVPQCLEAGSCPWPAGRPPLAVALHGGGGDHVSFGHEAIRDGGTELYGVAEAQRRLAGRTGVVAVRMLGRGQRPPWWRGVGEVDVLEVVEDVRRHYGTDPDRQVVLGGSLGGYGTIRLASLYPDLWSGAFAHCPAAYENSISGRIVGNVDPAGQPFVIDPLMGSMLHVPYRQASGTLDPLTPINANWRLRDRALTEKLDVRYTEYLAGSHCFDPAAGALPWIEYHTAEAAELLTEPRTTRPGRVRYAVDARHYPADPEPTGVYDARDIGLVYTGAYWVSGLVVRAEIEERATAGRADESVVATIDAVSHALDGWAIDAVACGGELPSPGLAAGDGGGNPDLEPRGPTPHLYRCQEQELGGEPAALLEVTVRNFAAGAVDTVTAGLHGGRFTIVAAGDGDFSLTLLGTARPSVTGSCLRSVAGNRLDLLLSEEPCTLEVSP